MANIYDMSDTWNDGATTFTSIKMDVTDTASSASSLLMDLQVGGASKFKVGKDGTIEMPSGGGLSVNGIMSLNSTSSTRFNFNGVAGPFFVQSNQVRIANFGLSFCTGANYNTPEFSILRDAANTLAQRNSTNAQAFNLYNTYTDASNYERGFMKWNSNVLEIGTEAAGTGADRNIFINAAIGRELRLGGNSSSTIYFTPGNQQGFRMDSSAHFYPTNDSQLDIGRAANKVRKIYVDALDGSALSIDSLPTSDPAVANQLWNDAGTLKISAG